MNTANRSFALVVATAAAPYGILLLAGCGFGSYLAARVGDDGFAALGRGVLLPTTGVLTLLLVGAVLGGRSLVQQMAATRRFVDHVDRHRLSPPSMLVPSDVQLVDHDEPFAFTYGLGNPRIAVSSGLVAHLSPEELEAVVVHERYHVRARDPLKLVIARTAARTCFFLPAVGHLVARYLAGRELAADRRSLRDLGRPAVAGALYKVVTGPRWEELDMAAAMAGPELLAVRVDQLEHGSEPVLPPVPLAAVALSAVVLVALGGIVTAVALQGGLSMMSSAPRDALEAGDLAGAVLGGLICMAGWIWLVALAYRRVARPALTTTDT